MMEVGRWGLSVNVAWWRFGGFVMAWLLSPVCGGCCCCRAVFQRLPLPVCVPAAAVPLVAVHPAALALLARCSHHGSTGLVALLAL